MLDTSNFRSRWGLIGGLILMLALVVGVESGYIGSPPGEYETRQGDILLSDGKFAQAIERFDAALKANPHYRAAMMGRAIALLQDDQPKAAQQAFDTVIADFAKAVASGDASLRGALAAAYADRGILYDRHAQPEKALADYRRALATDPGSVAGPGLIERVLYGTPDPATVAKRVAYLEAQLKLPPDKRVLTRPKIDARQRMYQP